MRAIWYESTGKADEVLIYGERQKPTPGPGEVLIRVEYSAVHPSDVKKRSGLQPAGFADGYVIPHSDGAGTIEDVGEGVEDRRGERVWIYQAQYGRHCGTCAEYIVVPSQMAPRLPENVDLTIGACIGIPMMTAFRCVCVAGDLTDKVVLVTGASGRVGYYAVQWSKLTNAQVIATAGSDENCQVALDAGADWVLNYRDQNLTSHISECAGSRGVSHIIDVEFGQNANVSAEVLNNCGSIATYSSSKVPEPVIPFYPMMFKNVSVYMVLVYNMPDEIKEQAISAVYGALERVQLKHRISTIIDLSEVAKAHELIESGAAAGSVLIRI
ncbi:MAG: NADPH:quinone reductase [Gammaproteobacteria bacterium]|nr:NADPH:quinone reductase [Gammaproteobacteria bacterium]MCY4219651.1 NADPH:quinone reductase [Gammaproteobacteria bacterium]MCY4275690.1 NADPH:quinone reductase [Gammaproteobacteria bacterium]